MTEHMEMLSATRSTEFRFTVTPQLKYSPDRARVSWIRTAYLVAFALLGWRYILQPALQPIRDQLAEPSAVILPLLSMYDPNGDPDRHQVAIVSEPTHCRSVVVISGRHRIFLPTPSDSRSLDELAQDLGARAGKLINYTFVGDIFPWPSEPQHLLDPAPTSPGN